MRPFNVGRILTLLHHERALAVARAVLGVSVTIATVEEAVHEAERLRIDPQRVAQVLTNEELRSLCAHRGVVPGPGCSRDQIIQLVVGQGHPGCEVSYLPWWGNPHES